MRLARGAPPLLLAAALAALAPMLAAADALDDRVIGWLNNYLGENETRLFASDIRNTWSSTIGAGLTGNWRALPSVCGGGPSIQTRSKTIKPNGGCPEVYTNASVSCTCLTGYQNSTEWEFKVKTRPATFTSFPLTLDASDVLEISSLMSIVVTDNITAVYVLLLLCPLTLVRINGSG